MDLFGLDWINDQQKSFFFRFICTGPQRYNDGSRRLLRSACRFSCGEGQRKSAGAGHPLPRTSS
jgi:hypothetical protein